MFKTFHQVHFNLSVNGDAFVKYAFMCLLILSFYIFGGGMSIPYYICLGLENLDGFISWGRKHYGPVWSSFMSNFTSSFTTSIAKQPILCPTLGSVSLKTHPHRVKHVVKLQKHGSLPHS
jgi:hypothetical protein